MQIRDLEQFGIPESIIDIWEREESPTLLPIQEDAVRNHGLFEGSSLLVSAPTTSGKTFIGEMAACQEALKGQKILFLVPLRAVAEEKFEDFETKYSAYGIRVVVSTGDHREYDERLQTGDFDLAVIVFEKLLSLSVSNPQILETANLIIVDECQMISDESRGSKLEILLTKILSSQSKPRLICLSAVAEESKDFSDWLGTRLLHSQDRPLELREGVVGLSGDFRYREWNSGNNRREVLCETAENEEQLRFGICESVLSLGEQALIFRCTPNDTIDTIQELIDQGLDAGCADEAIQELQDLESSDVTERLSESLSKGIGFHNGDMDLRERLLVERHFREGKIRILCATSTLAMGVNLPAKNVIVEPLRWVQRGGRFVQVPISVAEYRNMGGRAGRFRLNDDYGRSILVATSQAR